MEYQIKTPDGIYEAVVYARTQPREKDKKEVVVNITDKEHFLSRLGNIHPFLEQFQKTPDNYQISLFKENVDLRNSRPIIRLINLYPPQIQDRRLKVRIKAEQKTTSPLYRSNREIITNEVLTEHSLNLETRTLSQTVLRKQFKGKQRKD